MIDSLLPNEKKEEILGAPQEKALSSFTLSSGEAGGYEAQQYEKVPPNAAYVFEISWEVANKVGGIFTVLESKVHAMTQVYGKNYLLIGPYKIDQIKGFFEETAPEGSLKAVFAALQAEGINCHSGKWLVKGEPSCILIDFSGLWPKLNEMKGLFWDQYKVDSLNSPNDYNEPFLWGIAAGKLIETISNFWEPLRSKEEAIVVQAHEWLAGSAILYLTSKGFKGGSVFTTHATTLGRTLANNGVDFYNLFGTLKPGEEVAYYGIQAKHSLEKAVAQSSDVFTTVSEITSLEAEEFLRKKADVLLPNGLDLKSFPTFEEITFNHRVYRNRMREFLLYYFFPYYAFNLQDTLFYFILGRYEFHNKGIDIFIKSLGLLNKSLRDRESKKTIITFLWIPTSIRGIKSQLLESREIYRDIKESVEEISEDLQASILMYLLQGEYTKKLDLFGEEFLLDIKRKTLRLKRQGLPPLSTHDVSDPNDIILRSLKEAGLENREEDRVKVIYYPVYLGSSDGVLNLGYYEAIQGAHLGVFPSFYEPWGYTPLEAAALGVASVTTDLSGFGKFICDACEQKEHPGVFLLKRFKKEENEVVTGLHDILYRFSQFSRSQRIENKIEARNVASLADWSILIENYVKGHNMALKKLKTTL